MAAGVVQPESRETEWMNGLMAWWIRAAGILFHHPKIQHSNASIMLMESHCGAG
jgi:hypothetical protein